MAANRLSFFPRPALPSPTGNGTRAGVREIKALSLTNDRDVTRLLDHYGGGRTKAGVTVSAETAMRYSAVYACVQVLAQDVAKVPLIMYRRKPDGGKERAVDHPLYWILHDQPNGWQTSYDWRSQKQTHLELRGNAFSHIVRYRDEIRELIPINPACVAVEQDSAWRVQFRVSESGRAPRTYATRDILHLRGLSTDGLVGLSPIGMAREGIGLALAAEQHGGRMFSNGARPGGVLRHPGVMSDEAQERFKTAVEQATTGENAFRLLVLEEGMEWNQVGLSSVDAEWLASRKFQVEDIARFYRVPLHKIQSLDRATNNNIEHQSLEYVIDSLMSRLTMWEQRLKMALLTPAERKEFYFEFLLDGLLRGDTKSRWEAYRIARLSSALSANEIRARENMDPYDGGDTYIREANTVLHDAPAPGAAPMRDADA